MADIDNRYETIDPHCVPVVPGHDLLIHTLPNGNILLTLVTHQVDTEGRIVGVVTCRVEWEPEALKKASDRVSTLLEAGDIAFMQHRGIFYPGFFTLQYKGQMRHMCRI